MDRLWGRMCAPEHVYWQVLKAQDGQYIECWMLGIECWTLNVETLNIIKSNVKAAAWVGVRDNFFHWNVELQDFELCLKYASAIGSATFWGLCDCLVEPCTSHFFPSQVGHCCELHTTCNDNNDYNAAAWDLTMWATTCAPNSMTQPHVIPTMDHPDWCKLHVISTRMTMLCAPPTMAMTI